LIKFELEKSRIATKLSNYGRAIFKVHEVYNLRKDFQECTESSRAENEPANCPKI